MATDGIYLSDDNGLTFTKAFDLPVTPTAGSFPVAFLSHSFNLSAFAQANNLNLNNQVVIRFRANVGSERSCSRWVFFDDVSIDTNCPENIEITNVLSAVNATFQSSNQITASSIIENGSNVTLDAGNRVVLQPGFHAQRDNAVRLQTGGCDPSGGRLAQFSRHNDIQGHLQQANVYPNPNNGVFNLSLGASLGTGQVAVYNMMGKLVYSQSFVGDAVSIDISGFPKDIYTLKIRQGNEVAVKKIVHQ